MKAFFLSAIESLDWSVFHGSVRNFIGALLVALVIVVMLGAGTGAALAGVNPQCKKVVNGKCAKPTSSSQQSSPTQFEQFMFAISGGTDQPEADQQREADSSKMSFSHM